ncbi:MAG: aspartate/glutamate racemase family protein [Pseudomonadota bacterium]
MKTIGLIGGMSWESSLEYYRMINQGVREAMGGLHSAQLLLFSVEFQPIEEQMRLGRWDLVAQGLGEAARKLELGGADFILICTNTMHKVFSEVQSAVSKPLLHIGQAIGQEATRLGVSSLGLLGTAFTMEQGFLRDYLTAEFGLGILVPEQPAGREVHRIIFDELCRGAILAESRGKVIEIMGGMEKQGAEAVILGCTELPLLVGPGDSAVPLIDAAKVHAQAAVRLALD